MARSREITQNLTKAAMKWDLFYVFVSGSWIPSPRVMHDMYPSILVIDEFIKLKHLRKFWS